MYIVRFEMVSPVDHPEYYEHEAPIAEVKDVLPEDWKAVAVTHHEYDDALLQFRGLKELCRQGELIRNVKIRPVVTLEPTDWREVNLTLAQQSKALQAWAAGAQTGSGEQDQSDQDDQTGRHSA